MKTLKQWCLETAELYRRREPEVTDCIGRPVYLCYVIAASEMHEAGIHDLTAAISQLPDYSPLVPRVKWPLDESGFDARAEFLETYAEGLRDS